jgi:hypothetical protein
MCIKERRYSSMQSQPQHYMKWMASVTFRLLYFQLNSPGIHRLGNWVGPTVGLDAMKRKFLPCLEWNSSLRARNPSLHLLSTFIHSVYIYIYIYIEREREGERERGRERERESEQAHPSCTVQIANWSVCKSAIWTVLYQWKKNLATMCVLCNTGPLTAPFASFPWTAMLDPTSANMFRWLVSPGGKTPISTFYVT